MRWSRHGRWRVAESHGRIAAIQFLHQVLLGGGPDLVCHRSEAFPGEDQATLRSQADWLARYPNTRVTIEGHCDERGTREYNLALGERRANATKNALAALGVSTARITTVSYGKERPDATGSDEDAYARNRRAVTVTVQ